MKFKTIDTMEKIAAATRDGDQRALEEALANVNAASRLADNWPFDPGALQLLLVTLLKQFFDRDLANKTGLTSAELDDDNFNRAVDNINYATPTGGFQFKVARLLAELADMTWKKSIPGMERLILEMVAAKNMVRGEYTEPVEPFIHVAEAVIETLKRQQA